jgi:hypothetical protein
MRFDATERYKSTPDRTDPGSVTMQLFLLQQIKHETKPLSEKEHLHQS